MSSHNIDIHLSTNTEYMTNPHIFGPVQWYNIHTSAKNAINDDKKKFFIDLIYFIRDNMKCSKCHNHFSNYILNNPFDPFMHLTNDQGDQIGLFKWSWIFHNAVNSRLHKPIIDWDTAWNLYSDNDNIVCSKNCDESPVIIPPSNNSSHPQITMKSPSSLSIINVLEKNKHKINIKPIDT